VGSSPQKLGYSGSAFQVYSRSSKVIPFGTVPMKNVITDAVTAYVLVDSLGISRAVAPAG